MQHMNACRKNVDFKQPEPRGPDEKGMDGDLSLHVTTHACTRYAQRVLGLHVGQAHLLGDPALHGRCTRGVARLFERARLEVATADADIWIAGTRALVIQNGCVLTVITGSTSKELAKKFYRRSMAPRRAA